MLNFLTDIKGFVVEGCDWQRIREALVRQHARSTRRIVVLCVCAYAFLFFLFLFCFCFFLLRCTQPGQRGLSQARPCSFFCFKFSKHPGGATVSSNVHTFNQSAGGRLKKTLIFNLIFKFRPSQIWRKLNRTPDTLQQAWSFGFQGRAR